MMTEIYESPPGPNEGIKDLGVNSLAEPRVTATQIPSIPMTSMIAALKNAAILRIHLLSLTLKLLMITTPHMKSS